MERTGQEGELLNLAKLLSEMATGMVELDARVGALEAQRMEDQREAMEADGI